MLKIQIDIHPFGDPKGKKFGCLKIWNDGTSKKHPQYGNYKYEISDIPAESYSPEIFARGRITEFDRSLGYWVLVAEVLKSIGINKLRWKENDENNSQELPLFYK